MGGGDVNVSVFHFTHDSLLVAGVDVCECALFFRGISQTLGRHLKNDFSRFISSGYWKQGSPIAPFSSWDVGNDDAVVAVRAAYFKATDDAFSKNKFHPTNDQNPPE